MEGPFKSVEQVISGYARTRPNRDALIYLERGEIETERLTHAELDDRVDSLATGLVASRMAGKAVMIALPPGTAFVALFLACLRCGTIAIPVPFPEAGKANDRLVSIFHDASPAAIITDREGAARVAELFDSVPIITIEALRAEGGYTPHQGVRSEMPAFIQYTSGSTRSPKGIVITQGNIAANQPMIKTAFGCEDAVVGATWLPHFHDMGLAGAILQPLFLGGTAVMMPPRAFVQRPIRWLRAIEKYRATICGAPSFGYDLCVRTISDEAAAALDLSSWRVAFCGAEPVRASVLSKFAARFERARFRRESFLPCYGLAETTLIATAAEPGKGFEAADIRPSASASSREFVSCGHAVAGSSIVLRGLDGPIPDHTNGIGEICIAGPHVSPGTWDGGGKAIVPFSNTVFHDGKTYLATGDIGVMKDGMLFPVDRIGDTIIVYGEKMHAADIEAAVLDHAGFDGIRGAIAFALDDGERERVVVVCELDRTDFRTVDKDAMIASLGEHIAKVHGVLPIVRLVPYGALPRTSSGKLQRQAGRTKYLSGGFDASVGCGKSVPPAAAISTGIEHHAE